LTSPLRDRLKKEETIIPFSNTVSSSEIALKSFMKLTLISAATLYVTLPGFFLLLPQYGLLLCFVDYFILKCGLLCNILRQQQAKQQW
jgi:hypothetical protein